MKKHISIAKIARVCQVTPETIRRWIDTGAIPSRKTLGGHRRVLYSDFIRFVAKNKIRTNANSSNSDSKVLIVCKSKMTGLLNKTVADSCEKAQVVIASNGFEAGIKAVEMSPDFIIFGGPPFCTNLSKASKLLKKIEETQSSILIIAPTKEDTGGLKSVEKITEIDFILKSVNDTETLSKLLNL